MQFDELQKKLADFESETQQQKAQLDDLNTQQQTQHETLANTKSEQEKLLEKIKSSEQALTNTKQKITELQAKLEQRQSQSDLLNQQLEKARDSRNAALLTWWSEQYPAFANLPLTDLQAWIRRGAPSNSSKQHVQKDQTELLQQLDQRTLSNKNLDQGNTIKLNEKSVTGRKQETLKLKQQAKADAEKIFSAADRQRVAANEFQNAENDPLANQFFSDLESEL